MHMSGTRIISKQSAKFLMETSPKEIMQKKYIKETELEFDKMLSEEIRRLNPIYSATRGILGGR